jgi:hypothetical protein
MLTDCIAARPITCQNRDRVYSLGFIARRMLSLIRCGGPVRYCLLSILPTLN